MKSRDVSFERIDDEIINVMATIQVDTSAITICWRDRRQELVSAYPEHGRVRDLIQPDHRASPILPVRAAQKSLPAKEFHLYTALTVYSVGKVDADFNDCKKCSGRHL